MLGHKKALSLWRRRRPNFLALERALSTLSWITRHSDFQYAVVAQKTEHKKLEAVRQRLLRRR